MSMIQSLQRKFQQYWAYELDHTRQSYFFSVSPVLKFLTAVAYILVINYLVSIEWLWMGISAVFIGIILVYRINFRQFFSLVLILGVAYPLVVATPLIFLTPGIPSWEISLGFIHLTATNEGLTLFLHYFLRINATISAVAFLLASTPFIHIIHALRHLRIPSFITSLIMLTYRYFFFFFENLVTIIRADATRHVNPLPFKARFQHLGNLLGMLLLRSLHQGTAIHRAMLARGYNGEFPLIAFHTNPKRTLLYILLTGISLLTFVGLQFGLGR